MSFNRENTIWQSKDGTWNRGFYEVVWTDYDGDPEWDVEYGGEFWWVSVGHPSQEAAYESWDGSNPGSHTIVEYAGNPNGCDELDARARRVIEAAKADRHAQWGRNTYTDPRRHG